MAMPDIAQGSTLTVSGFTMPVLRITANGWFHREVLETTHLGTTVARTYKGSTLYEPGTLSLEVQYDCDEIALTGSAAPPAPWDGVAISTVLAIVGGSATPCTYTFNAIFTDLEFNLEKDQIETATVNMKVSGPIVSIVA